jgi:hypothetical protein
MAELVRSKRIATPKSLGEQYAHAVIARNEPSEPTSVALCQRNERIAIPLPGPGAKSSGSLLHDRICAAQITWEQAALSKALCIDEGCTSIVLCSSYCTAACFAPVAGALDSPPILDCTPHLCCNVTSSSRALD